MASCEISHFHIEREARHFQHSETSVNPVEETRRIDNAEVIIQKSKYDTGTKSYRHKNSVLILGDTLREGCLIALDAIHQRVCVT